MFARFATAIPVGAVISLALLLAMHALISMQAMDVPEITRPLPIRFMHVKINEELRTEEFTQPEKTTPQELPPLPETSEFPDGTVLIPAGPKPLPPTGRNEGLTNPMISDGPLITIVRVQPAYPAIAAQRGLEGFVVVSFDVFADGTVGNITVIESSSSIFERSAIQAAKRFRYKARVVGGEPQTTLGVQYRFSFRMDD